MKTYNKKTMLGLLGLALVIGISACGGGGGSGSCNRHSCYTHSQLARDFVKRTNSDTRYEVELVKEKTHQYDYVVIYDHIGEEYFAVDLDDYRKGGNIFRFWDNADRYRVSRTGSTYIDRSGVVYNLRSNVAGGTYMKDLATAAAFNQEASLLRSAGRLENIGFSTQDARDLAIAVDNFQQKMDDNSLTEQDSTIFLASLGFSENAIQKFAAALGAGVATNDFTLAASVGAKNLVQNGNFKNTDVENIEEGLKNYLEKNL